MNRSQRFLFNLVKYAVGGVIISLAVQYFFLDQKKQGDDQYVTEGAGQQVAAIKAQELIVRKPLNTEIDFSDAKASRKAVLTEIETNQAIYQFSSDGAVLQGVEFKRNADKESSYLSTILPGSSLDKQARCFLVAFNENTPFYFDLIDHKKNDDSDILMYKSSTDKGIITKQFTIHNDTFQIDVALTVEPKANQQLQPRIFIPSPLVPELINDDIISGFVNNERGNLVVHDRQKEETIASYWVKPTIFGTQDRYFTHALVKDTDSFAQRGYFKAQDLHTLFSIIEGPVVIEPMTWHMSFYVGPKKSDAFAKVDSRLDQLLYTGWLTPISKPLSKLLLYILNWLYTFVHNYGLAIIILTVLIRLLLAPFTWGSEKDGGAKQRAYQKKLKYIEERYKDDPQRLAAERADLIKKHGLPILGGMGGCLVMLFQMPIFVALSMVIANSIELYRAPFLWIPDLSARDPFYILPLLTGLALLFHTPIKEPQQRVSAIVMALFIGGISSNFSAGLALYFLISSAMAVLQNQAQGLFKR